jgi:hypothetical protein
MRFGHQRTLPLGRRPDGQADDHITSQNGGDVRPAYASMANTLSDTALSCHHRLAALDRRFGAVD